jgi:RNA polymerase sigma-70 factor (ECF subfamily)
MVAGQDPASVGDGGATRPVLAAPAALAQLPDAVLLALIAGRELAALGALYDRYGCLVFSIAQHLTHDRRSAEGVTQDVFQRVWTQAAGMYASADSVARWLVDLTRHQAIAACRARQAARHLSAEARAPAPLLVATSAPDEAQAALRGAVRAALATLEEEQREAIALMYYGGLTRDQIASALALPSSTVTNRVRQGLLRLRAVLVADGQQEARGAD